PGSAGAYGPQAVRANVGAGFAARLWRAGVERTPEPRAALVAHGGGSLDELAGAATICLGAERQGLPEGVLEHCQVRVTIPLRRGAESLNVAAAAAIALQRICEGAPQAKPRSNPSYGEAGEGNG